MASKRPADFRFPTAKQERAEDNARRMREAAASLPQTAEDLWWESVLSDPRANARASRWPSPNQMLAEINQPEIRVECLRCFKIIEVATVDARRFFGDGAIWRDVGQRLLGKICQSRTGNRDGDGCWPEFRRDYRAG